MKTLLMIATFLAWVSLLQAEVILTYDDPEEFSDFEYSQTRRTIGTEVFSKELIRHLERTVDKALPEGSILTIHFQDIDLAGGFEPWQRIPFDEVRFFRDRYPPRATFSYRLSTGSGEVLVEGEASIKDLNYQVGASRHNSSINRYYYERAMLERWIKNDLAKQVSTES